MEFEQLLGMVEKPSRYTGGEWNACYKDDENIKCRMAFMFPDVYEVGMSHLGLRILYEAVNTADGLYMERVFAPWKDMEALMREHNVPLKSLETKRNVGDFDIIAVTLQYEMSYTNALNMLELSGIPLLASERKGYPIVIAGGPCASNPEPLSSFFDLFNIGDGEEHLVEVMEEVIKAKEHGMEKDELLKKLSFKKGCYVPSAYETEKGENGKITAIKSKWGAPLPVEKNNIIDLNGAVFPEKYLVPNMGIVHDRVTLEIMRGCTRGCRFCQAGYIYRPLRERKEDKLLKMANSLIDNTGYNEVSLCSLSSADYSEIQKLMTELNKDMSQKCVSVALPSLRLDSFSREVIRQMPPVRKTGLTFAPEAGSQRLRDVINKNVTEEDLRKTVRAAFELGWHMVKLYFMIGLPTETMDDIEGIAELAEIVADEYEAVNGKKRGLTVTVSTSTFVPKSHTPFMWYGQDSVENIRKKQDYLKERLKARWFKYNWHDSDTSVLEAVFARGGREIGGVLLSAFKKGCRFDSWKGECNVLAWEEAFLENGIDMHLEAEKTFDDDEIMPWEVVSYGISKEFLLAEKQRCEKAQTIRDCRDGCLNCGLMSVCAEVKKTERQ